MPDVTHFFEKVSIAGFISTFLPPMLSSRRQSQELTLGLLYRLFYSVLEFSNPTALDLLQGLNSQFPTRCDPSFDILKIALAD